MRTRVFHLTAAVTTLVVAAACNIIKTPPPPLTGPSELGLSVGLSANPSTLTQDGFSQSLISIQARDANGQPVRNIPMRAEITLAGAIVDFGTLSTRNVVTDSNGRASIIYTSPPPPAEPVDNFVVVTILVTPSEGDFRNAEPRQIDIRLVPQGVIIPPNGTPVPQFTVSPTTPTIFATVTFDATNTTDEGVRCLDRCTYSWDFGDTTSGSGRVVQKVYTRAATYQVTLTVTDDRNLSASTTQSVSPSNTAAPVASFVFSPTQPGVNQDIRFNAAGSTPAPGRTIVRYDWNFGSGNPQSGVVVTKSYDVPGTYNVTLTVTDDAGVFNTASQAVTVSGTAPGAPTASFTFSPTNPRVNETVFFDGRSSSSSAGITRYDWDFGDGGRGFGAQPTHTFTQARTYVVSLTITDGNGRTARTTQNVTIAP